MRNYQDASAPSLELIEHEEKIREWLALPFNERFSTPRAIELCQYLAWNNAKHHLLETRSAVYVTKDVYRNNIAYEMDDPDLVPVLTLEKNMLIEVLFQGSLENVGNLISLCPELVKKAMAFLQALLDFPTKEHQHRYLYNYEQIKMAYSVLVKSQIPANIILENVSSNMKNIATGIAINDIHSVRNLAELMQKYHHYNQSPIINARQNPRWDNFCSIFNRNTKFLVPAYPYSKRGVILEAQRKALFLIERTDNPGRLSKQILDSELFSAQHFKLGVSYEVYSMLMMMPQSLPSFNNN